MSLWVSTATGMLAFWRYGVCVASRSGLRNKMEAYQLKVKNAVDDVSQKIQERGVKNFMRGYER